MDTASLKNSKRLHEVSGWDDTCVKWHEFSKDSDYAYDRSFTQEQWEDFAEENGLNHDGEFTPLYDAGYLLRKLPETIDLGRRSARDLFLAKFPEGYFADYRYRDAQEQNKGGGWQHRYDEAKDVEADTPEDALCLLAIKLFEEGVLTK